VIKFIAESTQLVNIVKSLQLTKKFFVSSLIVGEAYSGKKSVARHVLPDAPLVDGENLNNILDVLQRHDEVIINNFHKIANFSLLNFDNKRIIATALYQPKDPKVDELFGYIYTLPPLRERLDDAQALANIFIQKAKQTLSLSHEVFINIKDLDLNENSKSLEKSIYKKLVFSDIDQKDIEEIMYDFFLEHLEGNDDYKKYLPLFEKPLIEAGLKKYKSQLKLAGILGINRNTLRKKANEYGL